MHNRYQPCTNVILTVQLVWFVHSLHSPSFVALSCAVQSCKQLPLADAAFQIRSLRAFKSQPDVSLRAPASDVHLLPLFGEPASLCGLFFLGWSCESDQRNFTTFASRRAATYWQGVKTQLASFDLDWGANYPWSCLRAHASNPLSIGSLRFREQSISKASVMMLQ